MSLVVMPDEEVALLCNACHVAPRLPGRGSTWCRACKNAWQREYRAGVRKQVRVEAPVRDGNGCLIWQGAPDPEGYGRLWGNRYAHREAFLAAGGVLEPGETVDHLCEVKLCVEPTHLDACSRGENTRRYYARREVAACR